MDKKFDVRGLIQSIVREETRYLRHYIAQVVDNQDDQNRGRCKIVCPTLGWITPDQGVWAESRDKKSMVVPENSEYVEIYFIGGDRNYPCYLGIANEMQGMITPSYEQGKSIVFEDGEAAIILDKLTGILTIQTGDAAGWQPCIIPLCLFTGALHGGAQAGITKLKGN